MQDTEIQRNKEEYIRLFNQYILPAYEGSDKLLQWICADGNDFFTAPASTKYHLSEKGGLCKHTLNVYKRLIQLITWEYGENYEQVITEKLGVNASGLALVALCHDLCKCQCYKEEFGNRKAYSDKGSKSDEKGRFEWEAYSYYKFEPAFNFGHGSKSVFIIQNFVKGLSLDEAQSIRYHMGGMEIQGSTQFEPEFSAVFNDCSLAFLLHAADSYATYIDEKVVKE